MWSDELWFHLHSTDRKVRKHGPHLHKYNFLRWLGMFSWPDLGTLIHVEQLGIIAKQVLCYHVNGVS